MRIHRLLPLVALVTAACTSFQAPPSPRAPESAGGAFATSSPVASIEAVPDDWWRLYDDPTLDALVEASLTANADLRVAYANLDGARAAYSQARLARFPQMAIESGLGVDSPSTQPSAWSVPASDWDFGLTASWDIDLFGRLRAGALAARADTEAQQAALEAVKVAVVADTVLAYVELCATTRALAEARDVVAAQERLVELVRQQLVAGEVSPLELSQASTLAASSRAAVAPFEAQRTNALYRLATLQGRPPAEARGFTLTCTSTPRLRAAAPIGDGTALLLRRPDLREAERRLAGAAARVEVVRADLYPRLNLSGAIGLLAGRFDHVASPLLSWVFPTHAPARARLEQARAAERAALASWDAAVLKALREVETALVAYDAEVRRNRHLASATIAAYDYARRAAARVRVGDAASLLQIDAERALASTRLQRVHGDLAVAQSEVALFRALGGGWRSGPETY